MAGEYGQKAPSRRRRRRSPSCWLWFLTGGLCGALGMLSLAHMKAQKTRPSDSTPPEIAKNLGQRPVPIPEFDYQDILPDMKVPIPKDSPNRPPPALPPPPQPAEPKQAAERADSQTSEKHPPPATHTEGAYLLQVAALRNPADAERLRGKLERLGFSASIQRVSLEKGEFYRVRVGAYPDKTSANRARRLLSEQGLAPMVLRIR